jgi:hypothetical protein
MLEYIFYTIFLSGLSVFIAFVGRQKTAYLKSVKIFLVLALVAFGVMVTCDLIKNLIIKSQWVVTYTSLFGISAVIMAALFLECAALKLYSKGCIKTKKAARLLHITSIIFSGFAFIVLMLTWIFQPWDTRLINYIWGGLVFAPIYTSWYVTILLIFAVFFLAYPCVLFVLAGKEHKGSSVSLVLYWLGICWGFAGLCLVLFNGYLRWLGVEAVEAGYMINGMHFIVLAYFFTKTTTLESFFKLVPQRSYIREGEHLVLFYTSAVDKMRIFSSYIREGLMNGDRIIYVYPDEEKHMVKDKLKKNGINVDELEKTGTLYLMSLSEAYLTNGVFNKEWLIKFWTEVKNKTKNMGFKHERDLFDLGDLNVLKGQEEKYFEYLKEANRQLMDPFLIELRAVDIEKLDRRWVNEFKFLTTKSMDLLTHLDRFSRKLDLNHERIIGKKILLEFDPASDYEKQVQDFVIEALANTEPIVVFTSKGSAIHNLLKDRKEIKFLLLTPTVSSPQMDETTNEMLLPANNTSLMLDVLSKTVKTNSHNNIAIVFDNLSNLIFLVGFEKVHNFMTYAFEILSEKTTTLFLFNPSAHDARVASGIRSLFDTQIIYAREGLSVIKMPESELIIKPWSVP